MNDDQRIGQLLLREGVLTEDQLARALEAQKEAFNKPLGEILITMKIIDESDFLRVLAKKFHTQYLTTRKLSELRVPEAVLKAIPQTTAEKHLLFPVQLKRPERTLTIAMANPDDVAALDEVKFVSGMPNIKQLVCLKDSVKAAIGKWYKNDKNAFDLLLGISSEDGGNGYELGSGAAGGAVTESLENEDGPLDLSAIVQGADRQEDRARPAPSRPKEKEQIEIGGLGDLGGAAEERLYLGGMEEMPGDNNLSRDSIVIEEVSGDSPVEVEEVMVAPMAPEPTSEEPRAEEQKTGRRDVKKYRLRMLVVEPNEAIRKFIVKLFGHEGFKVRGVENREQAIAEMEQGEYDSLVIRDRDLGEGEEFASLMAERFPGVELCSIKDYGSAVIGETRAQRRLMGSFLETLDIVMGLYEMEGGGVQGHSHNTSKYARLIAAKLDLPQREVDTIALATYLHELGKKGIPHRALISIEPDADRENLLEQLEIPLKLLSSAKFPVDIAPTIRHQYERWDGNGIPAGLGGEDIPIGARVLAVVESFEHLTNKNTSQTPIEATAALEILKRNAGKLFDPGLVEIFLGVVRDDIYLQQMSGSQDRILIADTEIDLLTLLELRLANMGFAVATARTAKEAMDKAVSFKPALLLTEAEFPDMSGFEMIEKLKAAPATKNLPFIFLSRRDDGNSVTRGLRLGAEDYMTKPVKVDILGAKLNTMMSRLKAEKKASPAAAGVSGSLSEMSLPDIIQILGAGRKTGRITLEDNGRSATIDMIEGQVVNANIGDLKGEEGFYQILYWDKGSFSIDPTAEITERLITLSNDSLMLEGFRRMDEAGHGGKSEEDITLDGSDFF